LRLFGLVLSAPLAATAEGEIVYAGGPVIVHRSSNDLPGEIGMPVGEGDAIETGRGGVAVVSLVDGTEVKLRENTILSLASLGREVSVRLSAGSLFSRVNRRIVSGFAVRTETALMGVRGTEFFVAYGRRIDRHPDVWVCVNSGSVEVTIPQTQRRLIVEEGKGINIVGGINLTSPQRYPWTRRLNWSMNPESGTVIDRTDLEQEEPQMKTRPSLLAAVIAAAAACPAAANHIPVAPIGVVELGGRSSLLLDLGAFDPIVELQGRLEGAEHQPGYRALTVGGYLRLHANLKAGVFYRVQQGARHGDDWIEPSPGAWEWVDSRSRTEQVLLLEMTPRFLLPFLPGSNWVFALKSHYQYNLYNSEHSLMVRPGLTYFLLHNREPLFNFSFSCGSYIPLNFGETFLYEQEPYLSVLYHLGRSVKLELTVAYKAITWSSSADSLANGDSYAVGYRAFVVGLRVLFPVSF
jgi:hypothetical protein